MIYKKRDLINSALNRIGVVTYDFDIQPEDYQACLEIMDSMVDSWDYTVKVGYPVPVSIEESSLDDSCNLSGGAVRAIVSNLAVEVADIFSKQVTSSLAIVAKRSFDKLLMRSVRPTRRAYPSGLPKGSGNVETLIFGTKYFNQSDPPISADGDFLEA